MDELRSRLIAQKTITVPVRFPMTTEKAALYLETAVQAEVMARGNAYKISHEQKGHILQMAALLTRPSTQFGMLLCGGVGNGKTTMMKAFQNLLNYLRIPIAGTSETYGMRIESAKFLCSQVKMDSREFLHIQQVDMLGIDDLGEEEPEVVSYGNRVTPVIDLLSYRYDRRLFTMVTTNLTPAQIRTVYGDRIADRFNEMMLILPYRNPSYRSPQPNGILR